MYSLINVCSYIGNFNTSTPNYHHCLLSSNLGTILLGRKECDITYAYILDNYNSDFNFQMFPYINFNIKVVSDHYADHHMGTAIKVLRSLMHNTVVYIYLHSYKINILIYDTKICWISKETLMHNSDTLM